MVFFPLPFPTFISKDFSSLNYTPDSQLQKEKKTRTVITDHMHFIKPSTQAPVPTPHTYRTGNLSVSEPLLTPVAHSDKCVLISLVYLIH